MAAVPLIEETSGGPAGAMVSGLAGLAREPDPAHLELLANNRPERKLAVYPASAGFDLVEELDYLCARTIEPNVFFNPRFLAPAMPRLEDREVRLAVIRDGDEYRNRLRLLVPFSVERPAVPLGVPVMRTWASPFGPLGTPLIDRDDPVGVIEDFFSMLSRPHLKLPKVFVLPDLRLDGPVASLLASMADTRGLTLVTTGQETQRAYRPFVVQTPQGEAQALGTRFSVRLIDDRTEVMVFEHAVLARPAHGAPVRIDAGQRGSFTRGQAGALAPVDDSAALWEQGMLVVRDQRLADVVAELARHRPGVLRCSPEVAGLRVSGALSLRDTDAALHALADRLPIAVRRLTRYWVSVGPADA